MALLCTYVLTQSVAPVAAQYDMFAGFSCPIFLRFNKTGHLPERVFWSVITYQPQLGYPPQYYFIGAGYNTTGHERVACIYNIMYTGGIPGDIILAYDPKAYVYGRNWTHIVGMPGESACVSEMNDVFHCRWVALR